MQIGTPTSIVRGSMRNRRMYLYGALSCKSADEKRVSVWIAHLIHICAPWAYGKSERNRLSKYRAAMARLPSMKGFLPGDDPADWWKQ